MNTIRNFFKTLRRMDMVRIPLLRLTRLLHSSSELISSGLVENELEAPRKITQQLSICCAAVNSRRKIRSLGTQHDLNCAIHDRRQQLLQSGVVCKMSETK